MIPMQMGLRVGTRPLHQEVGGCLDPDSILPGPTCKVDARKAEWGELGGHTRVVGILFPQTFPSAQVEWHSAFCVYDHGKRRVVREGIEELWTRIANWICWDVKQFWRTWRGREGVGITHAD